MGVNLGVLPTKGLTLPLMSYGGSAILMNLVALAVVLRIDYREPAADARRAAHDARTCARHGWRHRRPHLPGPGGRARDAARAAGACSWLGTPDAAWRTSWCRRAAFAFETHRLRRRARQGPAATLTLLPLRLLAAFWQSLAASCAACKPDVGARHGRLHHLSRRPDGVLLRQAAGAGQRRRRAAAEQQERCCRSPTASPSASTAKRRATSKQGVVTGNPVRAEIEALPTPAERFAGRSGPLRAAGGRRQPGRARRSTRCVPQALALIAGGAAPAGHAPERRRQIDDAARRLRRRRRRRRSRCPSSTTRRRAWPTAT